MLAVRAVPTFIRVAKKLHPPEKKILDEAIKKVSKNPSLGEEKRGDLVAVFVYKFKINRQEVLMAYELFPDKYQPKELVLLALSSHGPLCPEIVEVLF